MGKSASKPYILYHKDGSVWARGRTLNGVATGHWVWFRKTGTKMRSGTFQNGEPAGEWTTYDQRGKPFKVTNIKPKSAAKKKKKS